jgi:hypothetical protein
MEKKNVRIKKMRKMNVIKVDVSKWDVNISVRSN